MATKNLNYFITIIYYLFLFIYLFIYLFVCLFIYYYYNYYNYYYYYYYYYYKWKVSHCIISYLVNNIPKSRKYTWTKESRIHKRKLEKRGNNDNKIKDFYWKRDKKINSIN